MDKTDSERILEVYDQDGEGAALRLLILLTASNPQIRQDGDRTTYTLPDQSAVIHHADARLYGFRWPDGTAVKHEPAIPLHNYPNDETVKTHVLHRLATEADPEQWEPTDPAMTEFQPELLHHPQLDAAVRQAMDQQRKYDAGITELLDEEVWSATNDALELLADDVKKELTERLAQADNE